MTIWIRPQEAGNAMRRLSIMGTTGNGNNAVI